MEEKIYNCAEEITWEGLENFYQVQLPDTYRDNADLAALSIALDENMPQDIKLMLLDDLIYFEDVLFPRIFINYN